MSAAGQAPRPTTRETATLKAPSWLLTRAHWVGSCGAERGMRSGRVVQSRRGMRSGRAVQSSCRLVLFAVSDGSGSGGAEFDFGSSSLFGCTSKGLRVEVVMDDYNGGHPLVLTGCKFSHNVPALGVIGYNVAVL